MRTRVIAVTLTLLATALLTGCASWVSSAVGRGPAAAPPAGAPITTGTTGTLAAGPVTLIALGDSLTAGQGDDTGVGYAGRLAETIGALPGREGTTLVNLGQSGWDSTMMVEGSSGPGSTDGQLPQAVETARAAAGSPVLATVLIGSNDLWYVYQNSTEDPAPAADEEAVVTTYRANLDRTVRELREAGAAVVVGLPDDQSLRPGVADVSRLQELLPNVTAEEVTRMSALAQRLAQVATEIAVAQGVSAVATDAPFWTDQDTMAEDGVHPNEEGYAAFATLWEPAITPLLG
ncbi:SGNH/GDSL hydrolase family protein [Pseudonocardia sp.]|uniref:SGNH/GDSL hydrolase family protein n=1 Tax=Pseudonocardia sp. TaxID=60912 RepID=UPI003D14B813